MLLECDAKEWTSHTLKQGMIDTLHLEAGQRSTMDTLHPEAGQRSTIGILHS